MSAFIGYWSTGSDNCLSAACQRLLAKALADISLDKVSTVVLDRNQPHSSTSSIAGSANLPHHPTIKSAAIACIAAWGEHARLETTRAAERAPQERAVVGLTFAASGLDASADVRVQATHANLVLGRDAFGRATLFWTHVDDVIWFSSQLKLLLNLSPTGLLRTPLIRPACSTSACEVRKWKFTG
ncbi:MAG: hypothetical protein WKF30_15035 [Pyrinomonadaceae bacterium]